MKVWLLLTLAFLIQEPISTTGILLVAYQEHYNLWLIHLLFIATTAIDFLVGYGIGYLLRDRLETTKFGAYVKRKFEAFNRFEGDRGLYFALFLYGPILFPISAIFIPWLRIEPWKAILALFIGELVFWYLYVWLLVLGASTYAANIRTGFYATVLISIGISFAIAYFSKRKI